MNALCEKIIGILFCIILVSCHTNSPSILMKPNGNAFMITGEVNQPGKYSLPDSLFTIHQALATAGDMTVFGMRNKIMLTRWTDGKPHKHQLNLDKQTSTSPYYYIQPGDVIYVHPNQAKTNTTKMGKRSTIWVSIVSSMISLGTYLLSKLKL